MTFLNNTDSPSIWSVVPAAGSGSRMGTVLPKQYLSLIEVGKTVIQVALEKLLSLDELTGIVVCTPENDLHFESLSIAKHPKVQRARGGLQRADSVLNGLEYLSKLPESNDRDWVLVHDAARPCVSVNALQRLLGECRKYDQGAILAVRVADTLKQEVPGELDIRVTVPREGLWQAHTPQCFKLGELREALKSALTKKLTVTDEASAMELCGYRVRLVEDSRDNIKITHPEDLALAQFILQNQSLNW